MHYMDCVLAYFVATLVICSLAALFRLSNSRTSRTRESSSPFFLIGLNPQKNRKLCKIWFEIPTKILEYDLFDYTLENLISD